MNQTLSIGNKSKIGKSHYKRLLYGIMIVLLFAFQALAGKAGRAIADLFSYDKFDYYNAFACVSGHDKMDINGLENSPPLAK